jgi:diamine N-acetyltransferase
MDSKIRLNPLTAGNWKACTELEISAEQVDYIPSNLYSIAEAQFYPEAVSYAIYNHEDQIIGYVLYGRDVSTQKWKIYRLMIDKASQGRGYGRAALREIIHEISQKPDGDQILIRYHQTNQAARGLYAGFGFVEIDVDTDGISTALRKREVS